MEKEERAHVSVWIWKANCVFFSPLARTINRLGSFTFLHVHTTYSRTLMEERERGTRLLISKRKKLLNNLCVCFKCLLSVCKGCSRSRLLQNARFTLKLVSSRAHSMVAKVEWYNDIVVDSIIGGANRRIHFAVRLITREWSNEKVGIHRNDRRHFLYEGVWQVVLNRGPVFFTDMDRAIYLCKSTRTDERFQSQ